MCVIFGSYGFRSRRGFSLCSNLYAKGWARVGLERVRNGPSVGGSFAAKNRQKPIGKGERFDQILEAHENDEDNVALVNALLGRTPSPTKRKAPAAAEPDTQYLDSPGFLPPQQKRSKTDTVVDLTAED